MAGSEQDVARFKAWLLTAGKVLSDYACARDPDKGFQAIGPAA